MAFTPGASVGPYQIIEQLGQGGMATVFKAYHPSLDRDVAIKVLHPAFKNDPQFFARFQREARIVARLEHPNIVPVYDFNEFEGEPYLVMRYVQGHTLKTELDSAPFYPRDVRRLMRPVCDALAYAHRQGILHRDIKPSNIIISDNGHVFLTDFGLARMVELGESTLSQDMMVGTPQYISPEQAQGQGELDGRTDIYALGVVLFEMLTGNVPYSADTPFAIIHDHIYKPLPIPSSINPDIDEKTEKVLLRALAKNPDDRFATMDEFWQALDDALLASEGMMPTEVRQSTPVVASEQTTIAGKKKSNKKKIIIGVLAASVLLCLCIAILSSQKEDTPALDATVVLVAQTASPAVVDNPVDNPPVVDAPPNGGNPQTKTDELPADVRRLVSEGVDLLRNDELEAAAEKFQLATELDPHYLIAYFYLANTMLDLNNQDAAGAVLIRAIENNAARPEAHTMVGYVLSREGAIAEARDEYSVALDLAPDYAPAYAGLARTYMLEDNMPAAEAELQKAMELAPDDPAVRLVNAEFMYMSGDKRGALAEIRRMANDPAMKSNPLLRDELRLVFEQIGERLPGILAP